MVKHQGGSMAKTESQAGALATAHVGLNVTDLKRSVVFYRQVFGFDLLQQSESEGRRFAFFGSGTHLVFALWPQSDGKFEKRRAGLHHLSSQVANLDELKRAEARVRSSGGKLMHDGLVAHAEGADSGGLFFEDPDGIRLEIYAPAGLAGYAAPTLDGPTCGFF